uniref:Conjugal transfer protein n=1 Tax=Corynebacterium glutamicum TaxID=1718 RepID=A0A142EAM9_CORGT|nr:type IV secretory system conjugative DNA transfer family protein [Corynebacterium glutamicum]AMQ45217.1 Conjugal transfer protein [Corynebacterium glutamicum]
MAGKDQARNLSQPGADRTVYVAAGALGIVVASAATIQLSALAEGLITGDEVETSINPILIFLNLFQGKLVLGTLGWIFTALVSTVLILIAAVVIRSRGRKKKNSSRIDAVSKHLASSKDVATLGKKAVTAQAASLVKDQDIAAQYPGLRIGHEVSTGWGLYGGWEDSHLVFAGPGVGKTTASVIPAIVEAPGVVVTTSNKPDIVYDTVGVTQARGEVWVFDPQGIATQFNQQRWYYDPLSYVRAEPERMDAAAGALAGLFASPYLREDGGGDSYFPQTAKSLLTGLLLAAALEGAPISTVLLWASDDADQKPLNVLAGHEEWDFWRKTLQGIYGLTERTRSGVFGQAQNMVSMLSRSEVRSWVDPQPGAREFSPYDFVRSSRSTLYLLSQEGTRAVGTLPLILAVAVMEAAENYGIENGGRLPVPLVAALDEAANVVPWKDLPAMYSHYRSRGIILLTYLQSYSQGIGVWGKEKMEALWSAASILLVGGGIRDDELLRRLSEQIGAHEEYQRSSSSTSGAPVSVSRSVREKTTITPAEISDLPKGRWLLRAVGRRPMIAVSEPYWERDWDENIQQALKKKEG